MPRRRIRDVKIYCMAEWKDSYIAKIAADSLVLVPLTSTQDRFRLRCGYLGIKIRNGCIDKQAHITLYDDELPKTKPSFNIRQGQMGLIENNAQFRLPALIKLIKNVNAAIEASYRRRWQIVI